MIKKLVFFLLLIGNIQLSAQNFDVEIGPIYGHYTDSTSQFWMLVKPHSKENVLLDWVTQFNADLYEYFETYTEATVREVEQSLVVMESYVIVKGQLNLKKKNDHQDISFLIGSCAFPYPFAFWSGKKKEVIFETMTKQDKDFMIWMGDNVYYLFGEWKSKQRMHKKNIKMRFKPKLKDFLESCPQYAVWDDHDFGDNNEGGDYTGKYESLELFKYYWSNPYYGTASTPGVFCHFGHSDADFFMLDSRFHASDSSMLGEEQMKWLQKKLRASKANFKFIISGTQVLPNNPSGEDLGDFGASREELLTFLSEEDIKGVIFLSGDRHYGELMKLERDNQYPLYEMTSSPLTSLVNPGYTKENPIRLPETLVLDLNFGKIHLLGKGKDRRCHLELFDRNGKLFWQHDIFLSELQ
ncbi:alkaline phosphatase D family protein [Aureispira anguillae]|uniref:Alkaline phosphatase family protein n=1 Tax=Aureispira anguillae TaxID=2864201 RepID=A0A915VK26_9BACT|nr:alkaline phosphatase D family protein [Aureispira anguillae]BDS09478.1 alkaline phosphatase family protein [Aureispira anguillae]